MALDTLSGNLAPHQVMGEIAIEIEDGLASRRDKVRTLVLVGRTGNGKSATGNSILGKMVFKSKASTAGVTSVSELRSKVLDRGRILNVIDTPGLFSEESVGREIVRCMELAKDGIHAVLMVLSVKTRFSEEERATVRSMRALFGSIIHNYMIVVFTGGDELEDDDQSLEDFLEDSPRALKDLLDRCGNRVVAFDNKTKDVAKKSEQVKNLLSLVEKVVAQNGGKPYTNELVVKLKQGAHEFHQQLENIGRLRDYSERMEQKERIEKAYDKKLAQISEMVEKKMRESMQKLEQLLEEERAARREAEIKSGEAQDASAAEIAKLRRELRNEFKRSRRVLDGGGVLCNVL